MIHLITSYLGPTNGGQAQVMRLACGAKAVTNLGVEAGQTLSTSQPGGTCPGCAEAMQLERMRRLRAAESAQAEDWRTGGGEDASLGKPAREEGLGGLEEEGGLGRLEEEGPGPIEDRPWG